MAYEMSVANILSNGERPPGHCFVTGKTGNTLEATIQGTLVSGWTLQISLFAERKGNQSSVEISSTSVKMSPMDSLTYSGTGNRIAGKFWILPKSHFAFSNITVVLTVSMLTPTGWLRDLRFAFTHFHIKSRVSIIKGPAITAVATFCPESVYEIILNTAAEQAVQPPPVHPLPSVSSFIPAGQRAVGSLKRPAPEDSPPSSSAAKQPRTAVDTHPEEASTLLICFLDEAPVPGSAGSAFTRVARRHD